MTLFVILAYLLRVVFPVLPGVIPILLRISPIYLARNLPMLLGIVFSPLIVARSLFIGMCLLPVPDTFPMLFRVLMPPNNIPFPLPFGAAFIAIFTIVVLILGISTTIKAVRHT